MKVASIRLDIIGPVEEVKGIISYVSSSNVDIVCFKKYVSESKNMGDQVHVTTPNILLDASKGKESK